MKLQLKVCAAVHKEMVTAVAWTPDNELFTVSDDRTVHRWDMAGEPLGKVTTTEPYGTSMSWFPSVSKQVSDLFVMGCSDGTFRFFSRAGREEKKVDAHTGAVVRVAWSYDGSALCSCGEDGDVKVWSRSGNLRSTLMQNGTPVYAIAWSPDNEQIAAGAGRDIVAKGVQAGRRQTRWAAHDGAVTALDWCVAHDLLVSGGEDRTYRVWDAFGRALFASAPLGHVVTAVAWAPGGEAFAVGAFNALRVCDRTGWTRARERPQCGSVMAIAWAADGTQLVGGGGNGKLVVAQVVGRSLHWDRYEAVLVESHKVAIADVGGETREELEFARDRVVDMALGHGHLVVATASQCYVYAAPNWNTPHILDMRAPASLLALAAKHFLTVDALSGVQHFLTVDALSGVQIWSYDGRQISAPKLPNLRPELLSRRTISLSADVLAALDRTDGKTVRLCDALTGRALAEGAVVHDCEVLEIGLSQFAPGLSERRLALIDRNRDLWLYALGGGQGGGGSKGRNKLHTQASVDSAEWNDVCDCLVALADGRLVTWYHPSAAYVDKDLMALACSTREAPEFGKSPTVRAFLNGSVTVRRADGALLTARVPPYPALLHACAARGAWGEALRLCRFVADEGLWAACAAMALQARNLDVAEEALAAIKAVDKLEYILTIRAVPSEEGRSAELALCRRCPEEAEKILLQATPPLVHRAIKLNLRLFRWSRALELAVQYRSHVDTVLGYRQRHLAAFKKQETDARFLQYAEQVTVDWDVIAAKEEKELEDERTKARGGEHK